MNIQQLIWNYQGEIASLYPDHGPIKALCQMIDSRIEKGRKVGDLQDQLLAQASKVGDYPKYTEVVNYILGGF